MEDTISLLDLLGVIVKRWKFIIITSLSSAVFIVLYSIYTLFMPADSPYNPLPNKYTPQVKVRLQESSGSGGISSFLESNSNLGVLAGLTGIGGGGSANADLAQELLLGNTIVDKLGEEFEFIEKYEIEKNPKTSIRKIIKESLNSDFDSATKILTIKYEDIDKEFATSIINEALDLLEIRFKNLTLENVSVKKDFLEKRLTEVGNDFKTAQNELNTFQKEKGIVDLESQTIAQIEDISGLSSQVLKSEIELEELLKTRRKDDPLVKRTQMDLYQKQRILDLKKRGFSDFTNQKIDKLSLLAKR